MKDENTEISFRPLSEGLGINHFTDGLPYAPQSQKNIRKPQAHFEFPPPRAPRIKTEQEAALIPETTIKKTEKAAECAGLFPRAAGFLFDIVVVALFFGLIVTLGFFFAGVAVPTFDNLLAARELYLSMFLVIYFGYFLVQEMAWGTTLGKSLFRIRLQNSSATMRGLRTFLFAALSGLSVIVCMISPRRRGLHDILTGSAVVREA